MSRPTPETDASRGYALTSHEGRSEVSYLLIDRSGPFVHAEVARKLERERDEAREELKEITEYGTEEINAAVDLRQKLASALIERDEARGVIRNIVRAGRIGCRWQSYAIAFLETLEAAK